MSTMINFRAAYHLKLCDVLFPEALLVFVVDGGQEVVEVHDDVNKGVDNAHES